MEGKAENESSASIRARGEAARAIQRERFKGLSIRCNGEMGGGQIRRFCPLNKEESEFMEHIFFSLGISVRMYGKILKVARTAADLDGREQKLDTIAALITHGEYERAIAFCNTKNMTDRLAGLLKMRGISCEAIHGDIQQRIREKTLEKFKRGEIKVLVATDVAARGLDIDDVDAVFNYDVPDELENYTHRIGRTGRAKRHGVAYTFIATITEGIRMDDIVRNTKAEVQRLRYDADGCLMLVEDGK